MSHDDQYVVNLGGGEEYYAADWDLVHCRHGKYIGYPGGADILCAYCEDGATELEHRMVAKLKYAIAGDEWQEEYTFATCYTPEGMAQHNELITLLRQERGRVGSEWFWSFEIESYWVRPE